MRKERVLHHGSLGSSVEGEKVFHVEKKGKINAILQMYSMNTQMDYPNADIRLESTRRNTSMPRKSNFLKISLMYSFRVL